jgi:excisionase family DNA binding protein
MKQDEEKEKYYRATEAAKRLSVSLPTLRKWAAEGKIKSFLTPGKRYRYQVDSFLTLATTATDAFHKRKIAKAKQLDLFAQKPTDEKGVGA